MLRSVVAELFQSERSASRHPAIEAERAGDTPPALPMQLVAAHAIRALSELQVLSDARQLNVGAGTRAVGRGLSAFRNQFADLGMRREQSYRMTLVGIRHGIDAVRLLREIALERADTELASWTDLWLEERLQLIARAEGQLNWFARFPEEALAPIRQSIVARGARSLMGIFGKADRAVSRAQPKRA
ncbi:MAG TPA: hypothetical protein VK524_00755 [Polyangiaceae bacterium]|nr:hypothetical protein [Polyangiaceae bacterium]